MGADKITIEVDIPSNTFLDLAKMAEYNGMTIKALIERVMWIYAEGSKDTPEWILHYGRENKE